MAVPTFMLVGLPGAEDVAPRVKGREQTMPQSEEMIQNKAAPLPELRVSVSLASFFTLIARKKRNPANFNPQKNTAMDESLTRGNIGVTLKNGTVAAAAKAPVPRRSR